MTAGLRCTRMLLPILVLSFLAEGRVAAQTSSGTLQELEVTPVPAEKAALTVIPIKCDSDQNIYVRAGEGLSFLARPVVRISADGEGTTRYSLDNVPDMQGGGIDDFTPATGGEVFLIAVKSGQKYLVTFDGDGKYVSKTVFDSEVDPKQIAAFESGDLFVAGTVGRAGSNGKRVRTAFAGVFNQDGKLLREVTINENNSSSTQRAQRRIMPATDLRVSTAQTGDDGNIYFVRYGSKLIDVISPGGEIIRAIEVPAPDPAAVLNTFRVGSGRIAVMFIVPKGQEGKARGGEISKVIFRIMEEGTGKEVAQYDGSSPKFGLGFACYDRNVFTFLGSTADGHMELDRGTPR
jgi:hypothetical protein